MILCAVFVTFTVVPALGKYFCVVTDSDYSRRHGKQRSA